MDMYTYDYIENAQKRFKDIQYMVGIKEVFSSTFVKLCVQK